MKHITLSFVLAIIATLACQGQGKYQISGFVLAIIATLACQGQGKYQISGKISGVADGATLLLGADLRKAVADLTKKSRNERSIIIYACGAECLWG